MTLEQWHIYSERLALYWRTLLQKRGSKNKLYILHQHHIDCRSKGKVHQRSEFCTKAFITTTRDSGIIIGALALEINLFDGHAVPAVLL